MHFSNMPLLVAWLICYRSRVLFESQAGLQKFRRRARFFNITSATSIWYYAWLAPVVINYYDRVRL